MPPRKIAVIAKLPELFHRDYCLAAGNQKCRVTLTGHERAKLAVLHNKVFPSDLTKIKAGKGALREFITTRRRRLQNGSEGAFS